MFHIDLVKESNSGLKNLTTTAIVNAVARITTQGLGAKGARSLKSVLDLQPKKARPAKI